MTSELHYPACTSKKCPLHLSCSRTPTLVERSPFTDKDGDIDILFVADNPNAREMQYNRPFKGPEASIIKRVLGEVSEEITYAVTYLVRGWPVDPASIPAKHKEQSLISCSDFDLSRMKTKSLSKHPDRTEIIDRCQEFILADIKKHRPKLLVVMGKTVKEALFPTEMKTITRLFDSFRPFKGTTTRFTTTPKSLIQNPSGIKQWEKQLRAIATGKTAELDTEPGEDFLITDIEDAIDYIEMLKTSTVPISVDLETLNLNKRYGNKIATIQFAETTTTGVTIPLHHPDTPFTPIELERLIAALYDLFHNPNDIPYWVGQNLKFECNLLKACIGTQILSAPIFDTQIAAFLVDENRRERAAEFRYGIYSLKQLAYDYLNFDGYDKGVLAQRSSGSLFDMELKKLSSYGAMDVYITLRLAHALIEEAERQDYLEELMKLMFSFYTPVIRLLCDMEQNGFYVNRQHIRHLISKDSPLLVEMKNIEKKLEASMVGQKANAIVLQRNHPSRIVPLGSTPWVFNFAKGGHAQALFFSVLRLPTGKVGTSGVPSVDSAWQNEHKHNEWVQMYSDWKGYQILFNTFATKLYARVDPRNSDLDCNTDTRIRPDFLSTGPVTGRFACRNPNLQNIPRGDSPAKKSIKNIFQATAGHVMVQLDYKANEVRWVGVLSNDDNLAKAINQGRDLFLKYRENPTPEALEIAETYGDLHKQTASLIFGKDVTEISKNERQAAKACLAAGTLTPTRTGFKPIEDITVGEEVWNGENWTPVLDLYRKKAKVVRLTTKRGWSIEVSDDHKLEVYDRRDLSTAYLCVKDLDPRYHYIPLRRQDSFEFEDVDLCFTPDDVGANTSDTRLQCPYCEDKAHYLDQHLRKQHGLRKGHPDYDKIKKYRSDKMTAKYSKVSLNKDMIPKRYPSKMTPKLAWWLGCLIAEGCTTGSRLRFTQNQNSYLDEFLAVGFELFGVNPSSYKAPTGALTVSYSVMLKYFVKYLGCKDLAEFKDVPWSILRSSKASQAAFIRGYMSGDGHCTTGIKRKLEACSKSKKLIEQLSVLLWNFGIINTVRPYMSKLPVAKTWREYYKFYITGAGYDRYFDTIGESNNITRRPTTQIAPKDDSLPGFLDYLKQIKKKLNKNYKISHCHAHELSWYQIDQHKDKYKEILQESGDDRVLNLIESWGSGNRPFLSQVESVVDLEDRTDEEVYDLSLDPSYPYFVAHVSRQDDCVFAILYGSSVKAVAEANQKTVEEVQDWFDGFYAKFPMIATWKKGMEQNAQSQGYVETPNGRRRRFPIFDMYRNDHGMFDPNDSQIGGEAQAKIAECLRQAVNAPIQGIASDAGMLGAALFADYVRQHKKPWVISNAVHDSCIYLVPYDELAESLKQAEYYFTDKVMETMTDKFGIDFNLPLEVEFELGLKWGELEKWNYSPEHLVELKEKYMTERGDL